MVQIKEHPPYPLDFEGKILLTSMARAVPAPMRKLRRRCRQALVTVDTANFRKVSEVLAQDALKKSTEDFVGVGAEEGTLVSFQIQFQSVANFLIYRSSLLLAQPAQLIVIYPECCKFSRI